MQQFSEVKISICIRRLTELNSLGGSFLIVGLLKPDVMSIWNV